MAGLLNTTTKKTMGGLLGGVKESFAQKSDLTTSQGLYQLAIQSGFQKDADRILQTQKGEEPKKIFSGGFISDIFDTLNAMQYGVVGILKGKSFLEGVQTRQSFSDKDALGEYGLPGVIGGIALDIASDPLTYIAPATIVKKIPGAAKALKAGKESLKATKLGQYLGRKFIYRFGQYPIYKKIAEESIKNIGVGTQNLIDIARPLTKLDNITQKAIAEARKAGKLAELSPELLAKAQPAFDALDDLGKQAVEVGLLPAETWAKNLGTYMPRLYKTKEVPVEARKKFLGIFPRKPKRIDMSRFKARKDIPEEIREIMGEILEAGYPTAKGLVQLKSAVENAKFFGEVATKWGKDTIEVGLSKLPEVKTLGKLSGKYVPTAIFDDIQEIIRSRTPLQQGLGKIVGGFKFGKVILNPATHARNIVSNLILNNFEGLNPARIDIYAEAGKELATKGKWYKEAIEQGLGLNTFAAQEIKQLLEPTTGTIGRLKGLADKLAGIYQGEENFAKMAQYIFQRKAGKTAEESWKIAERATFNYAQVTPFIRRLRESIFGYPFITFTYKVTPQVVKTMTIKPTRISNIGKIKTAIENQADLKELERERASEPPWIRDGFYIKLPIKDKQERSAYLDLSYIMPFGDLVSGQFFERKVERETGLPESQLTATIKKSPFINLITEIGKNQDFYGDKIWKESDSTEKQLGDLMRHLSKTYLPPLIADQLPGGHKTTGERRTKGFIGALTPQDKENQQRTLMQEMLRQVGAKIQPIDADIQESMDEFNLKKALRTLLEERGLLKRFEASYIPK